MTGKRVLIIAIQMFSLFLERSVHAQQVEVQSSFRVKFLAEGVVYLEAGRDAGLSEGLRLTVKREQHITGDHPELVPIAEIRIIAVATSSAVCAILSSTQTVQVGDIAYLSPQDVAVLRAMRTQTESGKYPQVVTFNEGDPLEEEMRQYIPRPPSPEINRIRGRIGLEYSSIQDGSANSLNSNQLGLVLRGDVTRLAGSFWNFSGYWRGRINSRSSGLQQQTLRDLINRTYHLTLSYNNPASRWVAGAGRLYLPWATSVNTIDGGYLGRRYGRNATLGIFGGSSPDPTSWNYDPQRRIAGAFLNFDGGSHNRLHYSSTTGAAATYLAWKPERQYAFFENALLYKRVVSLYHSMEADIRQNANGAGTNRPALGRSYLTVRIEPHSKISFDISHNYFREIPTFDPRLVSTGLVDKLLFQGASAGMRLSLPFNLTGSINLGRSDKTGDLQPSLNQMYGLGMARIGRTGVRADFRYSRFDSSFGRGTYQSISFSRELFESLRLDIQMGQQNVDSQLSRQNRSRWVNSTMDWFFARRYFLGAGYAVYRGDVQNYIQWYINMGYRF